MDLEKDVIIECKIIKGMVVRNGLNFDILELEDN